MPNDDDDDDDDGIYRKEFELDWKKSVTVVLRHCEPKRHTFYFDDC